MLNFTAAIFADAGSDIEPKLAAIIIGVIQLLGGYVATVSVERAGRKVIIIK